MTPSASDLKAKAITSMVAYMSESGNCGYAQLHIDQCSTILTEFHSAIQTATARGELLNLAKNAVLSLNRVNNTCDGSLIETDQREYICAFMIKAASETGLTSNANDFTEEWREW